MLPTAEYRVASTLQVLVPENVWHNKIITMVASAIFITDLSGKSIISRNYRGDVPLTKAIERFANYLNNVEDEAKKPVFQIDPNGDVMSAEDVGSSGPGGETYVYVAVSTSSTCWKVLTMDVSFSWTAANTFPSPTLAQQPISLCRHC